MPETNPPELKPLTVQFQGIDPDRLYTLLEVSAMIGRTRNHLYIQARDGALKTANLGSSSARLVRGSDVIAYVNETILQFD